MNQRPIGHIDLMSIGSLSVLFVISAIGIVVCSFILVAVFYFLVFDAFTRDLPHITFLAAAWSLSCVFLVTLWLTFARRLRRVSIVDLSTDDFFRFQIACAACVGFFVVLLRIIPNDTPFFLKALSTVFDVLLIAFTGTYFSLAWASGKPIPPKTYGGLCVGLVVVALSMIGT